MRKTINIFLFAIITIHALGQQNSIIGIWRTSIDFSVSSYTFDTLGQIAFKQKGCMSGVAFKGRYIIQKDTIYIKYDSISTELQKIYQSNSRIKLDDTLIWINRHKIQIAPNYYIYNQDRDEQVCLIKPNGLFTYKARHFDDVFTIKQFNYNEWEIIDTITHSANEYIELINYPLFLHSGLNKFGIYANNRFVNDFFVEAAKPEVKIVKKTVQNQLIFSDTTIYEVQDRYGNKLLYGRGKNIDCSNLTKGKYIVKFDNRTGEFLKQ